LAGHVKGAAHALWFPSTNRDALGEFAAGRLHVAAVHGSHAELERLMRRIGMRDIDVFELATIEEGWIVAAGNPLKLRGARDLERPDVRLANRAQGSAARALLDAQLRRAGVSSERVNGYDRALQEHADVARAIAFGYADIGIGVGGVADAFKLGFIPLRSERCVLIARRSDRAHTGVAACISALRSTAFRRDLDAFGPYDLSHIGESF
jgi:putative molybdopterin biosynthesis protein